MLNWLAGLLLSLSALLGVKDTPQGDSFWKIEKNWTRLQNGIWFSEFSAEISKLDCDDSKQIYFPAIIHGAHEIFVDGKLVNLFNDPEMRTVRSFYGHPVLECRFVKGSVITWKIYSNTKYFARFFYWPTTVPVTSRPNFLAEISYIAGAGALLIFALYLLTGVTKNVLTELNLALAGFSLSMSLYMAATVPGLLAIKTSMLTAHKFADINVIIATIWLVWYLKQQKMISRIFLTVHYANSLLSGTVIFFANSGDQVQVGTTLLFFTIMPAILISLINKVISTAKINKFRGASIFDIAGLAVLFGTMVNDVLCVLGIMPREMVLPIGFVGGTFSFATAIHSWTAEIYSEREHLRKNLESEVINKTAEIEKKRAELQENLEKLKQAQAELVQSAKLASLGTLAAGIAHEINNSINYVNGALMPLERLIGDIPDEKRKAKVQNLMRVMQDGVTWTVSVVKSLRLYTGLNQTRYKEARLKELVEAVINILQSRIRNKVEVKIEIPNEITIFGNIVGLNQVIMNLVSNALDAMDDSGTLEIKAEQTQDQVKFSVSDTGKGIDEKTRDKIFDPFFTTKEVGKGTGLGLHIVKQEIDRHKGRIKFESQSGKGTTFFVELPKQSQFPEEKAA